MLFLAESDILQAVTVEQVMDTIESTMLLYEKKDFHMPARAHLDYGENTLLLMPCFTKGGFGTKLVTVFPNNAARNAPVTDGVMLLNHGETGAPMALLNGRTLTAMRTGAVGGVSVRHLARKNAATLGVIGAGVQGFYQALFASSARNVRDIYIFDLFPQKLPSFMEKLSQALPKVKVHKAAGTQELLEECEIIVTATTSQEPVLPDDQGLLAGKHFVGIGSFKPSMREFPECLFKLLKRVYVDTEHAVEETGDLLVPLQNGWIDKSQVQTLGQFLMENGNKAEAQQATTLFKSVGMALFDLTVSQLIYEQAVQKGLGQEISL